MAPLTACSIVLEKIPLFISVFLVEISMLSLCVVNDCPANFSLAVQRHTNGRRTCGAHKLRIRRIGQPACLPVSIYLLFFLSARSQRDAKRCDATPLHSTRLSGIFSAGHSSFFMALTLSLVSANKHKQQQQRWQVYFLWPRLPLSFSLLLSLSASLTRRPLLSFLVLVTRCQIY